MQHPDEGTIHSWLDGALSADEAARMEAHVKDCPECAAAVAEARGFIAASSRILTALDNVPRGVMPAAVPKKRVDPIVWRVAATLLVVAGGTFVVLRNGGGKSAPGFTKYEQPDSAESAESATVAKAAASPITIMANPARAPGGSSQVNTFSGKRPTASAQAADMSPAGQNAPAAVAPPVAYSTTAPASRPQANSPMTLNGNVAGRAVNTAEKTAPIPRALTPAPAGSVAALDATSEPQALKIVGAARQIGAKTTLYEVAPGDTVTLTEIMSVQLESVVVTSASTVRTATQPTEKSVTTQATKKGAVAPAVTASDSQDAAAGVPLPAPAQAARAQTGNVITSTTENVQVSNGVTTISWTDQVTRNVMKLSGRMSPARLQQVKTQIERERAAEAAKKKP
jgi:putative zinc finger protein